MTQSPPDAKPPEKASAEEQISDLILKFFKTGGIAGAGIGGFWSLFAESNVPKAMASAAIGLAISYVAKLGEPLHRGNQRRLEKAGEAIEGAVDRKLTQVTGVEERYLQCQAWACRGYRSEGMAQHDRIFVPMLEEVYVPLQFDLSARLPGLAGDDEELCSPEMREFYAQPEIWDLLKRSDRRSQRGESFRQIVILAWGGFGKTTLLKHIAYTYGMNQQGKHGVPRKIPFLLMLRKYRSVIAQENPPSLPELITQKHLPSLPDSDGLELPIDWVKDKLRRGDAVVMLDGFDEVAKSERPKVAAWINQQMTRYGRSVFILTSRPKAYTEQDPVDRLELTTRLWVKEFNPAMRQNFVQKWYLCQERFTYGGSETPDVKKIAKDAADELLAQIEARRELQDLAKNPLLLNMIVTFHRRFPGAELPKRRVELYQEICRLQLRDRPSARQLETLLLNCEAQTILQLLALEMMVEREERLDRATVLGRLAGYLTDQAETVAAKEFLEQVVQISELLVEREPGEFEFAHLSFQEYLAAVQIFNTERESLLYGRFRDDRWKQTILLYTAQLKKPETLIRAAHEAGATDLAYQCLQETKKQVDSALRAQLTPPELTALEETVQTSRYQQLETYLRNRQWEEADDETYRLMITTVGKEEGQWFDREELLNFPCEPLKQIDGLWVKYSQGHFGFSVQKQIYLNECGGIADGKYHEEAWEKFCHTNGWMKGGEYQSPSYSSDPFSSKKGHLPRGDWGVSVGWGVVGVWVGSHGSSLASRLVKCNL